MMQHDAFSLLELNAFVKEAIKGNFPDRYKVVAEIASLYENRSGHCYLELIQKGEDNRVMAKCSATIWSYSYRMLKPYFESTTGRSLSEGIAVLFDVAIEFHEVYGYSLQVKDIDPAYTIGESAMQKQQTLRRLQEEGLFDANRDLPEPPLFQRIAVVSSATAAGYEDFCMQLQQNPYKYAFTVRLFPAVMQGDQAVASVCDAMAAIGALRKEFDAIVIIRGGGSKSDLHCFDSYDMAAAVAHAPLPVLSGIGHERDESVLDQLAFYALKTPTAVAEYLIMSMYSREQELDAMLTVLSRAVYDFTASKKEAVQHYLGGLHRLSHRFVNEKRMHIRECKQTLLHRSRNVLEKNKAKVQLYDTSLHYLDPANIIKKGYSLTMCNGKIIKSLSEVELGDVIETRLTQGTLSSKVVNKE